MRYLLARQVYGKDYSLPTSVGKRFVVEIVSRVRLILSFSQSRGVRADNLDRELENSRDELTAARTANNRRKCVERFADRVSTVPRKRTYRIRTVKWPLRMSRAALSSKRPYKF